MPGQQVNTPPVCVSVKLCVFVCGPLHEHPCEMCLCEGDGVGVGAGGRGAWKGAATTCGVCACVSVSATCVPIVVSTWVACRTLQL